MSEKQPVVLLTDIGSDIDDALALQCFLNSPKYQLTGVVVTHGVLETRAKLAAKMIANAGQDIPVGLGAHEGIAPHYFGYQTPFVTGFEGIALTKKEQRARVERIDGVELLQDHIRRFSPIVVGIAPLTSLAQVLTASAGIASYIPEIRILAGNIEGPEHNIMFDIAAAQKVFSSRVPITLIPIDSVEPVPAHDLTGLKGSKNQRMIALMARAWKFHREMEECRLSQNEAWRGLSDMFERMTGMVPWRMIRDEPKIQAAHRDRNLFYASRENPAAAEVVAKLDLFFTLLRLFDRSEYTANFVESSKMLTMVRRMGRLTGDPNYLLFDQAFGEVEITALHAYDAYVPFLLEHPEHATVVKRRVAVSDWGNLQIKKGTSHALATGFDHEKFRDFLRTRLHADTPLKKRLRT